MSAFYQKHFLKLLDFTPAEITALLELAAKLKAASNQAIFAWDLMLLSCSRVEAGRVVYDCGSLIKKIEGIPALKKTQPVHDALSKLPHTIKAPA